MPGNVTRRSVVKPEYPKPNQFWVMWKLSLGLPSVHVHIERV